MASDSDNSKKPDMSQSNGLELLRLSLQKQKERLEEKELFLIEWLRQTRKANKVAQSLFEHLSFSDEHFKTNSAKYLEIETKCDYYDLVKFLKTLDATGLGKFVAGRKGKDTRIDWKYHPKSIGTTALGKTNRLNSTMKGLSAYDGGGDDDNLANHSFLLRPELVVDIVLPTDFSKKEAERLSRWLNTIPFD